MKQISLRIFFMTRHSAARSHCVDSKVFQKIILYPMLMHTPRHHIHFVFRVLKLREPHPKVFVPPSCRCKKFFDYLKTYFIFTLLHSSSIAFSRTDSARSDFLTTKSKNVKKRVEIIIRCQQNKSHDNNIINLIIIINIDYIVSTSTRAR